MDLRRRVSYEEENDACNIYQMIWICRTIHRTPKTKREDTKIKFNKVNKVMATPALT